MGPGCRRARVVRRARLCTRHARLRPVPGPSEAYGTEEEVAHLRRLLDLRGIGTIHLVTHSLGSMFGLHLRRALGARVTKMTLIDPVVVSVLRERGEDAAYAEMEEQYQRFMSLFADHEEAAHFFVDHWTGPGAGDSIGRRRCAMVTSLVPKLRLEMIATRSDTTGLALFAELPLRQLFWSAREPWSRRARRPGYSPER